MFLLILSALSSFLVIDIKSSGGETVSVRVPKDLAESALEFAKIEEEGAVKINDREIPADSVLKIIKGMEVSDEPFMEIIEEKDTIKFWIRAEKDVIEGSKKPERLKIDIEEEDDTVHIRLPIWVAKMLPSFIVATGEDAEEIKRSKELLKKSMQRIEEMKGGFTMVEIKDGNETVKISFE